MDSLKYFFPRLPSAESGRVFTAANIILVVESSQRINICKLVLQRSITTCKHNNATRVGKPQIRLTATNFATHNTTRVVARKDINRPLAG